MISPSVSDALQVRCPCGQTAARLNQLSELTNRVSCQSPSKSPELAVRPSSPTRPSQVPVQVSCPSSHSELAACSICPSQQSESSTRASRAGPWPASADQVDHPSQLIELTIPVYRLHQLLDGAARAGPDRPSRPNQPSESVLQGDRRSPSAARSAESAVRVSRPSQSSQSAVHAGRPSQPSESVAKVDRPSLSSEAAVGVSGPSQSSGSVVRVHQPCLSSESATHTSHPEWLATSRPDRESISVESCSKEWSKHHDLPLELCQPCLY